MRLLFIILAFFSLSAEGQIINASAPYRVKASGCSYLLDCYSGAAAAYSLRKLDADYAGSAIRVRRSSDNAESDIGFVNGNLDTATLKTFIGSVDGRVTTWYDQSGNGRNATQTTAAVQPRIVETGVVVRVNGLPAVDFIINGFGWWLGLPTGFLNGETAFSYIHVAKITDWASSNGGVFGPSNSNSTGLEILQHTVISRRTLLRINGTIRNDNSGAAYQLWPDAAQGLTEVYADASSVSAYNNSASVTLTSSAATPALNFNGVYAIGIYNSTGTDMNGLMQELVIYYSNQSSNKTGIQSNINTYYTIY